MCLCFGYKEETTRYFNDIIARFTYCPQSEEMKVYESVNINSKIYQGTYVIRLVTT